MSSRSKVLGYKVRFYLKNSRAEDEQTGKLASIKRNHSCSGGRVQKLFDTDLLTHRTNGPGPEAGVQLPPDKHLESLGTL